jgi:hypothetical protein
MLSVLALIGLLVVGLAPVATAQDDPGPRRGGRAGMRSGGERPNRGGEKDNGIKPYDEVITDEAKTDPGLFLVHRLDEKVFYELPVNLINRDMLWVTQIAKTQSGFGYGGTGVGNRVVRWELRDEKVLLRDVKYRIRTSDEDDSVARAVEATSLHPIIRVFDVKAWGKDKAPVIDVTGLFTDDIREFSPAQRLNASGVDSSRTFLEETKSFPENIETKVLKTFRLSAQTRQQATPFPRRGERRDRTQSAVTVLLHYSMVLLPEKPMQPRVHDDRVGFFTVRFEDYGTDEHQVKNVRYITRWRMEPSDPEAEVCDPVKPIVFHVGRGVPDKWRPYVHQGIEMWQPAFEAAGFSNAIIAKDAPSEREDPDWDAEDARYSSIRWLPSTTENAMGPHVHDPRSGEILESDIIMYHNILKLCRDWYFVQASPCDERAQKLPLPDELLGELLAYVVAHEVGHTLGFPHNMKASSSYTVEQLRDPEFTAKYGTEASIMDYGRFNYVAQPGDGAALIPTIGPYDFFAVEWGYRRFAGADTPKKEKPLLAEIVARQIDDPMLLFGDPNPSVDPTQQTEDLGSDPILATEMGLQNIDRVLGYLVEATSQEGENYEKLQNMYGEVIDQRNRELGHVVNVVAGVVRTNFWYGDADRIYAPLPADEQRAAVAFLHQHAFQTPRGLIEPDIVARLEPNGAADRIVASQKRLLRSLLSETRIKRLAELTEQVPDDAYPPIEMLEDLRAGIFNELEDYPVTVDLYRRNLQRAYVELLADAVKQTEPQSDLPALARGQLENILAAAAASLERETDETTQVHLKDLEARIGQILEGRFAPAAQPAAAQASRFGRQQEDE